MCIYIYTYTYNIYIYIYIYTYTYTYTYNIYIYKALKQYVGQTVDMFRSQWNNYKDNSRKFYRGEDCMQRHLYEHFQLAGHTDYSYS